MNIGRHVTVPLQAYTYHINVISLENKRMSQIMAAYIYMARTKNQKLRERMFLGANTQGASEKARERKGQGARRPKSKSSTE